VAILEDENLITAAASFGLEFSSLPRLNSAKKTTPPEFTVTYIHKVRGNTEKEGEIPRKGHIKKYKFEQNMNLSKAAS